MEETNYISREPLEGEDYSLTPTAELTTTEPEEQGILQNSEIQKAVWAWIEEYRIKNPGASNRNIRRTLERNYQKIIGKFKLKS